MNTKTKKKIFVGVSGGVDSSVALNLLKKQGHDVVGVFIRTWQPDWIECTWQQERRDAMRVCAHVNVPFIELDLEQAYKEGVADYMIREYKAGRTPNPDVMCNREVKFGGFLKWARAHGADYIATGHYAARRENPDSTIQLLRGKDKKKDQSYFLWMLEQEQLTHTLFPLGGLKKDEVRKLATKFNLPTAQKKDSQGICFIGEIDMKEFLSHYIEQGEGEVINIKGEVIGTHNGALFYTISERHGFTIHREYKGTHDLPYYIIAKDVEKNTLTVSQHPQQDSSLTDIITLEQVVDNQGIFKEGMRCEAQIRYRGEVKNILITSIDKDTKKMTIVLEEEDYTIARGQSVVLYEGMKCLGGGIIA